MKLQDLLRGLPIINAMEDPNGPKSEPYYTKEKQRIIFWKTI